MKKLFEVPILFFAGMLVLAACGSSTTSTVATTYPKATSSLLVSAASLNVNASNQVIIDTRSAALYAAGHITGAIHLSPSSLDTTSSSTVLNTAPTGAPAVLGAAGVSNTATIIVYGAGNPSSDFGGPERVFWALEYMGAKDVHVLDGGYPAWTAITANTPQTTANTPAATTFTATVDTTKIATKADVLAHYSDTTNYAIVDSRFAADFSAAHIPNAVNILETDYLNTDGTTKSYADIKTLLDAKGVTAGKTAITHCYVGYMSGQGYFMLRLMGFNVSNYDGSWAEWAADTSLPTTALSSKPAGIATTGGNGQVTLGWPAATGASTYNIYYGTATGVTTSATTKVTGITGTSKTITGLTNGTTYYFIVTAVNSNGESAISSEVSVIPAKYNTDLLWSTTNLTTHSTDSTLVIVDARTLAKYTTGHITGAISLPGDTFDEYNTSGITTMLEEDAATVAYKLGAAGISHSSEILIYGDTVDTYAARLFWILEYLGAKNVHILDGGYTAWAAVPNTAQTTANTKTATTFTPTVESIKLAIKSYVLASYADTTNYSIVDSREYDNYTTSSTYIGGHIPKAVSILTSHFLQPASPNLVLPTSGITAGTGCTLNTTASAIVAGTSTVTTSGGALTAVSVNAGGTGYTVGNLLMVGGGNHAAIVSVTSIGAAGDVTGVALTAKKGVGYVSATDVSTRDYTTLENVMAANGITAGKTIITHCWVGWRSSLHYFIFRYMGYNVSNYDGSWTEWSADTTAPVNTGATP